MARGKSITLNRNCSHTQFNRKLHDLKTSKWYVYYIKVSQINIFQSVDSCGSKIGKGSVRSTFVVQCFLAVASLWPSCALESSSSSFSCSESALYPTNYFTIPSPRNVSIHVSELHKFRGMSDFVNLKLRNVRSGAVSERQ